MNLVCLIVVVLLCVLGFGLFDLVGGLVWTSLICGFLVLCLLVLRLILHFSTIWV